MDFYAARTAARSYDHLGRPMNERPDRYEGMALANPAALGAAFVPSSAAGRRDVHRQQHAQAQGGRFGESVEMPQSFAGQYVTAPTLSAQEQIAAEAEQAQHQAVREHVGYLLPGRWAGSFQPGKAVSPSAARSQSG